MKFNTILQGDSLSVLCTLPDECVHCVITSPPYWGLRDYGAKGQLGLEKTPEEFISKMVAVFQECRRVLKKEGTLWLNIGDSYSSKTSPGIQGKSGSRANRKFTTHSTIPKIGEGLKSKDLVGIPWMLAFALRSTGWYLRQDIIWSKPNPMPESVTDRCTKAHEYIFLLSKSSNYYFDQDAIREPAVWGDWQPRLDRKSKKSFPDEKKNGIRTPAVSGWGRGDEPRIAKDFNVPGIARKTRKNEPKGSFIGKTGEKAFRKTGDFRNRRSVWTVGSKPFLDAHFATFPEKLIEPMVLAGCPQGGVVLDPFMGAGTTAVVAITNARAYLGIELNPSYIKMAEERISRVTPPML